MVFIQQIFIEFFLYQALFLALNEMDKNPCPYEAYFLLREWGENKLDAKYTACQMVINVIQNKEKRKIESARSQQIATLNRFFREDDAM